MIFETTKYASSFSRRANWELFQNIQQLFASKSRTMLALVNIFFFDGEKDEISTDFHECFSRHENLKILIEKIKLIKAHTKARTKASYEIKLNLIKSWQQGAIELCCINRKQKTLSDDQSEFNIESIYPSHGLSLLFPTQIKGNDHSNHSFQLDN